MEQIANSYAQALFELAVESGNIQQYKDEIQSCLNIINMDSSFLKLLKNPTVSKEDKKEIMTQLFKGNVSKEIEYFLYILVDKNRITNLKQIYLSFNKLVNEYHHVENAVVYSVVEVSKDHLESIKSKLQVTLDKEIIIENKIDKSLIAGIKIVVGNKVLDQSLKAQIANLHNELLDIKI